MRTIGVVTTSRADYGIYRPLLDAIRRDPDLRLMLIVSGMHLSPEFGLTVRAIEEDGFEISERVEMLLSSDSAEGTAKSIGIGTLGFASVFGRTRPDILVLLGDRFEMLAAAVAALPFNIPMAHIHGGELTEGAIDEAIRHALTKMSHLHFATIESYARRIVQLGEEPWRVTTTGALSIDNLAGLDLLDRAALGERVGLALDEPFLLVTWHPVTLEPEDTERQIRELLAALEESRMPIVLTYPNADAHGRMIIAEIERFVERYPRARVVQSLGTQGYFSLMRHAAAMVGNSSSGIIEAATFSLPVVNIGTRQRGREHGENVIDCGYERHEITAAIERAVSPEFRESLHGLTNLYGEGSAAARIIERLKEVGLNRDLLQKRFHDLQVVNYEL